MYILILCSNDNTIVGVDCFDLMLHSSVDAQRGLTNRTLHTYKHTHVHTFCLAHALALLDQPHSGMLRYLLQIFIGGRCSRCIVRRTLSIFPILFHYILCSCIFHFVYCICIFEVFYTFFLICCEPSILKYTPAPAPICANKQANNK